ncbi:MAG: hypothetical protein ACXW4N_11205 [Candidatus Deferrimicrobiaceae bacterium]
MIGFRRSCFLLVIAATVGLAAGAWAEGIFPVNDAGTGNWVFDQPSVVTDGAVVYVAFVGDNGTGANNTPNTRVYYAAVNPGADFANFATTRSQVLLTAAVAIDNTLYNSARHPQIAQLSPTQLAILFQAIPSDDATSGFKLFRALVTIANNVVTSQRVDEIRDAAGARIPGSLTDPSFGIVLTDNTLRVTFSSFPSLVAGSPYSDVYYARVGWDTSRVLNNPILLTKTTGSTGVSALPRLVLDGNNYSHIVWASNNTDPTRTTPSAIYYAMVQAIAPIVVDNLAIGATQVLTGGNRWGFPNILLTGPNNIWILAGDEPPSGWSTGLAGSVGISEINPYAVVHDGNPVNVNNVGANTLFFLNPPGGTVLSSDFNAYQPAAALDSQNRMQVAGYGFRFADGHGTPGRYYVMSLGTTASGAGTTSVFASMVGSPVSVGIGDLAFAVQLPGDYTRPAFVHFSGKSINFWSGPDNVVPGARNLYVTSTFSPADPTKQSGCSMVDDPRRDESGRIPGAAVLLLPAALLALRRAARKAFGR